MWTIRYTTTLDFGVFEVYCQGENQLLILVQLLQNCIYVQEFKVGKFLVDCREGDFGFRNCNKWVKKFSHETKETER